MNIHLSRAELLLQQGRFELAEEQLRLALAENSDTSRVHALLAHCLLERAQFDEAIIEAQQAIHDAPDQALGFFVLATIHLKRRRLSEARPAIEEAIRIEPSNASHFNVLAAIEAQQYHWKEALAAAEEGLACDPDDVGCNNLRAMALVNLGRKAEAGQSIDATLAKHPEDAVTHANQGWTLLHQQQPKLAMTHFREALRLDPELEWARLGIIEAMKARFFLYRWLLTWFLWLQRFPANVRLGLMLGLIFGRSLIANLLQAVPVLEPLVTPLTILYVLFVWMTWTAPALFNLVLRLDSFGRLVLNDHERLESTLVGICLVLFLMMGLAAVFLFWEQGSFCWQAAMLYLGLMMPVLLTMRQAASKRKLIGLYTAGLTLCIVICTFQTLRFCTLVSSLPLNQNLPVEKFDLLNGILFSAHHWFDISMWGIVISTWIGAGLTLNHTPE